MYSPKFTVENKTFCLSLHYNGDDSYLFVNGKQVINFKAKDSEIKAYQLCLGNISKDFCASDWKTLYYMEMFMILVLIIVLLQMIKC